MDDDALSSSDEALDELLGSLSKIDETNWGPWKLDRSTRRVYIEQPTSYNLSIAEITGPAGLFDCLGQLNQKTWATNECLGGLARASFAISNATGDPIHKSSKEK